MAKIWKGVAFVLTGFILGMIAAIKFIAPPGEDIEIKFDKTKLVIKGKNNQVTDAVDVTPVMNIVKEARKSKRQQKKEDRKMEREKRKLERKNKKSGSVG